MSPQIVMKKCLLCGETTTFEFDSDCPITYYGCDCRKKEHYHCIELIKNAFPEHVRIIPTRSGAFTFIVTVFDKDLGEQEVEIQQEHENVDPMVQDDDTIWVYSYRTSWKQFD